MAITRITKGVIKPNENYDTHNIVSTGIITSVGADINGDLDVDGHTNLDNVSISGVTTFAGSVNNLVLSGVVTTTGLDVNGNADISGNLSVGGVLTYEDVTSIDSIGIITARNDIHVGAGISVVGVGSFGSLDIGGDIDVDGHTNLDNVSVAGVSTFTGLIDADGGIKVDDYIELFHYSGSNFIRPSNGALDIITGGSTNLAKFQPGGGVDLYFNGTKRFETENTGAIVSGILTVSQDLDVDGHTNLDNVSIAGVTTMSGDLRIQSALPSIYLTDSNSNPDYLISNNNGNVEIRDITNNGTRFQVLSSGTVRSFGNFIAAKDLDVDGHTNLDNVSIAGVSTFTGAITANGAIDLNADLDVDGHTNLDNVSVAGVTTFTGAITANGAIDLNADLDVDGHTELDNVNVVGVTTFNEDISFKGANYDFLYDRSLNTLKFDQGIAAFGTSGQMTLQNQIIRGVTQIQAGGLYIKNLTNQQMISCYTGGQIELYHNNVKKFETSADGIILSSTDAGSSAGPEIKLFRNSASPADADYLGQIKFAGESDTGVERNYAKITGKILDASNGTEDGIIEFAHIKAGSQTITGRWRSDSLQLLNGTALTVAGSTTVTGNIIPSSDSATDIGTNGVRFANIYADTLYGDGSNLTGVTSVGGNTGVDFNDSVKARFGTGNDLELYHDGTNSVINITSGFLKFRVGGTDRFEVSGSGIYSPSTITSGGTITVYGHVNPHSGYDSTFDLGTNTVRWRNAYVDTYYGDGSNLTGISVGIAGISTTGTSIFNNVTVSGISTINSLIVENYDGSGNSGIMTVPWKLGQSYSGGGAGGGTSNQVWGQFAGQNLNLSAAVQNVIIGREAAKGFDRGDSNVFIGSQAGPYDSGNNYENCDNNTVVSGHSMYFAGGNAKGNSVFGYHASYDLRGAQFNTTVGYAAAKNVMNGGECVVIGHSAAEGSSAYHPNSLVAIGASAAKNITSAQNVIVIGNNANPSSNTPSNEITLGDSDINHFRVPGIGVSFSAGGGVVTGIMTASSFKLLDGSSVGGVESDAQYNTVGGTLAGNSFSGTNATDNTLFGYRAGASINSGDWNTVLGAYALDACTSGSFNLALGRNALTALTDGIKNIAVGHETLASNQSADNNVAVGAAVMNSLSTGEYNTAVGNSAMLYQDTAVQNTSLGYETLKVNTKSSYNVAIGYQSMVTFNRTDAGGQNTAVGWKSGDAMTVGRYNSLLGGDSGGNMTDGEQNSCFGYAAGRSITSGSTNTCVGYGAGKDSNQTGNNNIIIGNDAESSSTSVSNEVTIGDANITKFRIPGINVTLKDNGGTPTQGHVLTVDGNGEAGFAAASGTTINNNADNRIITGSGSANTLEGEANFTFSGSKAIMKHGTTTTVSDRGLMLQASSSLTNGQVLPGITLNPNTNVDRPRAGIAGIGHGSSNGTAGMHLIFMTAYRDDGSQLTSSDERVRIDSSGRMMIGTTTEGNGNADEFTISYINHAGVSGGDQGRCGMTIRSGDNTSGVTQNGYIYFSDGTSGANESKGVVAYEHSNDAMYFSTDQVARLRIDSSGRVLIGTTTEGHSNADTLTLSNSGTAGMTIRSTSSNCHIYFSDATSGAGEYVGQIGYNHGSDYMFFHTGGSERLRANSSGITVTGTVDSASDVILKENIKTIDNALDKVTKLRGVEYDYKENKKHSIGVIAQEVEEVLPELVNGTEQKSVAYGNIAAVLIEAIKEQNEIINKMKKEIEDLKG